jgi:hypothetical protein
LVKRKIVTDSLYQKCELETENKEHILWSCPAARQEMHDMCRRKIQKSCTGSGYFIHIVPDMENKLDDEEVESSDYCNTGMSEQ